MKPFRNRRPSPLFLLPLLAACSQEPAGPDAPPASDALARFVVTADPGPALGVVAAKQKGAQQRVVVEGRVHDVTKGFAILKLMDASLDYCGQIDKSDTCPTPWDYCCDSKEDRLANSLLVEMRGPDGRPLTTPSLPNLRLCDLAKVTGELVEDEHGNLVLVADGLYRAERPELPDYVRWPQ